MIPRGEVPGADAYNSPSYVDVDNEGTHSLAIATLCDLRRWLRAVGHLISLISLPECDLIRSSASVRALVLPILLFELEINPTLT
jgi:hypothetical protein